MQTTGLSQTEQIGDQLVHAPRALDDQFDAAASFRRQVLRVAGVQRLRKTQHCLQRGAKIVRDRVAEGLELGIGDLEFLGALDQSVVHLGQLLAHLLEPVPSHREGPHRLGEEARGALVKELAVEVVRRLSGSQCLDVRCGDVR